MMYWNKIYEEILNPDFKPSNPKSNKSIITIYSLIENGQKIHITSDLKGEFIDPFLFNIEQVSEKASVTIIYDRTCMIPDKLYDTSFAGKRYGFLLHDNIVKVFQGE